MSLEESPSFFLCSEVILWAFWVDTNVRGQWPALHWPWTLCLAVARGLSDYVTSWLKCFNSSVTRWNPLNFLVFSFSFFLSFFFFFLIQGLTLARQVLYHLNHSASPSLIGYFWDRVSRAVCPGWLGPMIFLISASWVARIIGVSHQRLPSFSFS
jgi:hypothetical protein